MFDSIWKYGSRSLGARIAAQRSPKRNFLHKIEIQAELGFDIISRFRAFS